MAGGWSKDGAVQDQIDASVGDAVKRARQQMPRGESLAACEECEQGIPPVPPARQTAIPGVRLCVTCQEEIDSSREQESLFNSRGSKDSQLR